MKYPESVMVSVMMPTFNAIDFVDVAVLSVMAQSYGNWELLAYDDCSDDGTFERIKFWAEQDDRIHAARPFTEHGSYVDICNQMLGDSKGEYLARIDADDVSLPARLDTEVSFLHRKRGSVLVASMARCIMEEKNGEIVDDYPWIVNYVEPIASEELPVNESLKTFNRVVHSSLLARRTHFLEVGGYDDLFPLEDWDLALKFAKLGDVYVLPDVLALKRQHAGNSSRKHPNTQSAFETIKERYRLTMDRLPSIKQKQPTPL